MIGMKNKTNLPLRYSFNGVEYNFGPNEIRIVPRAAATHLMNTSSMSAIGGSPLVFVPDAEVAEQLAAATSAVASPSVSLLYNIGSADVRFTFDGNEIVIPAGKSKAFPKALAESLYLRRVTECKSDLSLTAPSVAQEPSEVPAEAPETKRTYTRRTK